MFYSTAIWSDPIYNQISRIFCLPGNRFQTISCKILLFLFLLCQSFSIPRTWLIQPPYPTKMAAVCSQKKSQKNLQFANNIIIKNCHLIKLAPLIFTSSELTKEVLGRMLSQTVKRQRERLPPSPYVSLESKQKINQLPQRQVFHQFFPYSQNFVESQNLLPNSSSPGE